MYKWSYLEVFYSLSDIFIVLEASKQKELDSASLLQNPELIQNSFVKIDLNTLFFGGFIQWLK